MNLKSTFNLLLLLTSSTIAAPSEFELRAVAERPNDTAQEYKMPERNGREETILLEPAVLMDSTALKSAAVSHGGQGGKRPEILITLTEAGAKLFATITRKFTGQRIAILVAGKPLSAPRINEPINGGTVVISGTFTEQEAAELAARLTGSIKP